jgi:hypothetical protein
MTHPERIAEAGHDRQGDPEEARDQHLGSENPNRVPVKDTSDPSKVDLPEVDQDRDGGSDEVRERTRREMR